MPKVVACPGCGAGYEVGAGTAEMRFACGACGREVSVPGERRGAGPSRPRRRGPARSSGRGVPAGLVIAIVLGLMAVGVGILLLAGGEPAPPPVAGGGPAPAAAPPPPPAPAEPEPRVEAKFGAYGASAVRRLRRLCAGEDWSLVEAAGAPKGLLAARHAPTGLDFLLVPGGFFRMGDRSKGARPFHDVRVPPFLLCRTEVSQAVWDRVGGDDERKWDEPTWPITHTAWLEVSRWLAKAGLRLPSEAEWEYACRAGTTTLWSSGAEEEALLEHAWISVNSDLHPHPVGTKKPNPWGFLDMHGNVWEYVEDRWHDDYRGAPEDGSAWVEPESKWRVIRGGSWYPGADFARSGYRAKSSSFGRSDMTGFRPAADLPR